MKTFSGRDSPKRRKCKKPIENSTVSKSQHFSSPAVGKRCFFTLSHQSAAVFRDPPPGQNARRNRNSGQDGRHKHLVVLRHRVVRSACRPLSVCSGCLLDVGGTALSLCVASCSAVCGALRCMYLARSCSCVLSPCGGEVTGVVREGAVVSLLLATCFGV